VSLTDSLHDPVTFAIPAFVAFLLLELVSLRVLDDGAGGQYKGYDARDSRTSLWMGFGSIFVTAGTRAAALIGYSALYELSPLRIDSHRWYSWIYAVVVVDLIFYGIHRGSHRIRLLWAGHQAHHSSQHFNLSTALRQKWNPWFELVCWTPLPLLGMPPWMIFTAFSVNLIFQFWVHTEKIGRLPRAVEFVLNTPSHHRVHHGSNPEYLDRNYGGMFIVWDRLFGSYAEESRRPTYGLTKNVETFNPFRLQYYEYAAMGRDVRAAPTLRAKLGYIFAPPGWQPTDRSLGGQSGRIAPEAANLSRGGIG
jgi:sterol desaturase/sphingolipid hydroxylase (fatty acid hydroxylase superfamily)